MIKGHIDRVEARLLSRSDALLRGRDRRGAALLENAPASAPRLPAAPGKCRDCGGRILAARLEAVPGAERCVGCQRAFEHTC